MEIFFVILLAIAVYLLWPEQESTGEVNDFISLDNTEKNDE